MDPISIAVICAFFIAFALVSGRLAKTWFTAPMAFIGFGFLVGPAVLGWAAIESGHGAIHLIAEVTLILVLFTDASRIDIGRLKADHNLPIRMLVIGLPLVMVVGALVALGVLDELSLWEAALLAAILAPTDAALGQAVVSDPAVPVRIRQALNVESGLNDGVALPAVLLFASLAATQSPEHARNWFTFASLQLTLGPLVGAAFGWLGAKALDGALERDSMNPAFRGLAILAVAVLGFTAAEAIGGNGFIAAFVAGLIFGNTVRNECEFLFDFMEAQGELLMLLTFLFFGATMLPVALTHFEPAQFYYALLSLTLVRLVPITLSLLGTGIRLPTYGFLGWFGPRGLASILFALLILEEVNVPHAETILSTTVITVALSAALHGATAVWGARTYGRLAEEMGECEEMKPTSELPIRSGYLS